MLKHNTYAEQAAVINPEKISLVTPNLVFKYLTLN